LNQSYFNTDNWIQFKICSKISNSYFFFNEILLDICFS